jgi:hypothetical protein
MCGSPRLAAACAALLLFGCGSGAAVRMSHARDGGSHRRADAGVNADAGDAGDAASDAATVPDAGHDAGGPVNDSFETATPIDLSVKPRIRDITRPSEVDYYSFDGEAGAYYALSTDYNSFSPDTIITLFDPDKQLIGENDSGAIWPGDNIDSRLVVRLQRSGTYYVRVQNHLGDGPVYPPIFYHLKIERLSPDADGVTVQTSDSPAQVRFAHDMMTGYSYATVLGDFAAVQAIAFEVQAGAQQILVGHVLPSGPQGTGSTARVGVVSTTDPDGNVLTRIDASADQQIFHPPLDSATYQVRGKLSGDAGDNGFFAIDLTLEPDNPREQAEAKNDTLKGAEAIDLKQDMGFFRRRGLLLSSLPENDVDYYRFDSPMVSKITIGCEGQTGGSGVIGLHVELRDGDDKMLAAADEVPNMDLLISSAALPTPGTYYVRLSSKTKTVKDPVEPWARCAVIARP